MNLECNVSKQSLTLFRIMPNQNSWADVRHCMFNVIAKQRYFGKGKQLGTLQVARPKLTNVSLRNRDFKILFATSSENEFEGLWCF